MSWIAEDATLRITIATEGPLSVLGHDRVFDQPVEIEILTDGPDGKLDGAKVRARADLRETRILGKISDKDRKEMLLRKDRDVFQTARFPEMRFEGKYIEREGVIDGRLHLHGKDAPCRLEAKLSGAGPKRVEGAIHLDLREFGIKPYSALLGAMRVSSEVEVAYGAGLRKV